MNRNAAVVAQAMNLYDPRAVGSGEQHLVLGGQRPTVRRNVSLVRLGCQEMTLYVEDGFVVVKHPAIGAVSLGVEEAYELIAELGRLTDLARQEGVAPKEEPAAGQNP